MSLDETLVRLRRGLGGLIRRDCDPATAIRPARNQARRTGERRRRRGHSLPSVNRFSAWRPRPVESLEPRRLLTSNVVISEFMAINNSGLGGMVDSFGDKSDWIEIHNNGVTPVDLAGWKLMADTTTWTFPSSPTWTNSVVAAGGFLTVFASGQNTVTLGGTQLHTNFKLPSDGEYLALLRPDNTVAYEYAPQYPAQIGDVSYGITETSASSTLLTQGATSRILVPTTSGQLPADWNSNSFDASASPWIGGTTGVGFQTVTSPGPLNETEPNGTIATANSAVNNFGPFVTTQYELTITGNSGGTQDWFKIGAMQIGDVLTVTGSGPAGIPANTATDVDIQLWRGGSGSAVKTDADSGPGNDGLIDHFSVTTADTYYVMIQRKTSATGGTYNVNAWLDNASTAPITSGSFSGEVESNDTLATANDASTSWRGVGYKSTTAGTITAGDIDVDQYQFTAGDLVSINVTASGGLDAKVAIKNSSGTVLAQEDGSSAPGGVNTANSSIYSFKIPSSGQYYVQIQSSAATTGSYSADVYLSTTTAPPGPPSYTSLIGTNVQSSMQNHNASVFVRVPFNVTDPTTFNSLDLRMKYDDGFVAYLNGVEVARRNAGGTPGTPLAWNAAATASRTSAAAIVYEDVGVSNYLSSLVVGTNVLAIQGLNVSSADGSFLVLPQLLAGQDTVTGQTFFSPPTPGATNANPVTGQVTTPTVDKTRGFYNSAFYATLAESTAGAQIRYTLNGAAPTATTGTVYSAPISIDGTTTLRFAAFESGMVSSTVDTETYLFLGSGGAGNHPLGTVLGQPSLPAGYPVNWVTTSGASTPADYAMDPTVEDNPLYSGTYDTAAALKSLSTLSLVGDPKSIFGDGTAAGGGIYANPTGDGVAWETPVSVEWIDPPSALNPNGNGVSEFQVDAGLRIHGGASRNLPTSSTGTDQHSLRLLFKKTYGAGTLDQPIFQDAFGGSGAATSFDTVTLRGTYNNAWTHWDSTQRSRGTYTRDEWDRDVMTAMGDQTGHGRYIQVYINGLYWGLYNLEELPEASFAASYFGGDASTDWDAINGSSTRDATGKLPPTDGTNNAWYDMISILRTEDMTSAAGYSDMQKYLNVTEFSDYMIDQMWAGNNDWPQHNWYADARVDRTDPNHPVPIAGGQFRFFAWDSEHILESSSQDMTNLSSSSYLDSPGEIYTKLKTNPEFQLLWADRVHKFMFNNGILTASKAAKLFSDNLALVDQALVAESARWGDNRRPGNPYTRDNEYITEKNRLLGSAYDPNNPNVLPAGSYFAGRNATVLAQFRAAGNLLYPATGSLGSDAPEFNIQDGDSFAPGFVPLVTNPTANTPGDKIYYTFDGSDPRLAGGAVSPTAIDASVTPIPALSATTRLIARRLNGTVWSASNDVTVVANPNLQLKITELNYNPYAPPSGSFTAQDFEFIELKNTGTTTLNLNGFKFSNGVTFTFPNMNLPAGAFTVVVSNQAAFQSRYGTGISSAGAYTGHFNNGGEEVALVDPLGVVLQDFTYDNGGAWPGRADGKGSALDIISTTGNYNDPANWRSSVEYGGSPGAAGLDAFSDVVINELLANSNSPLSDTIELYNPTATAVNVGGWWLSDTSANLEKFRIPDNTILQAGQYLDFDESNFNAASPPAGDTPFSLSSLGGGVWLTTADAAGNLLRFADHVTFDASAAGVSLGRWPNGVGAFLPLASRTFAGATGVSSSIGANSSPRVGQPLISEIDYNPGSPNDDREFVEIGNPTASPIDLSGWQLRGDVVFDFAEGASIPAGGAIVVVHFDPSHPSNAALMAGFRSFYGIGAGIPLYGPYSGILNNGGGALRLSRPDVPVGVTTPYVLVDEATFDDVPPWPTSPDGMGASLNRRSPSSFGDDSASWLSAAPTPGSLTFDPAQWKGPGGGSFNNPANWSDGVVPNGTDAIARFLSGSFGITSPSVITIDSAVTVNAIIFDSPNGYTLSGPAVIAFSSAGAPQVSVVRGSHTIAGALDMSGSAMGGSATIGNGAALTATAFRLDSLVIGTGATVTVAASDAEGNSLTVNDLVDQSASTTIAATSTQTTNANSANVQASSAPPAVLRNSSELARMKSIADPVGSLSFNTLSAAGNPSLSAAHPIPSRPSVAAAAVDHILSRSEREPLVPSWPTTWHSSHRSLAPRSNSAHDHAMFDLLNADGWIAE